MPSISLRENERLAHTGSGWNPTWYQPIDVFSTFSDKDFRLGLNAARTTLAAVAQFAGRRSSQIARPTRMTFPRGEPRRGHSVLFGGQYRIHDEFGAELRSATARQEPLATGRPRPHDSQGLQDDKALSHPLTNRRRGGMAELWHGSRLSSTPTDWGPPPSFHSSI